MSMYRQTPGRSPHQDDLHEPSPKRVCISRQPPPRSIPPPFARLPSPHYSRRPFYRQIGAPMHLPFGPTTRPGQLFQYRPQFPVEQPPPKFRYYPFRSSSPLHQYPNLSYVERTSSSQPEIKSMPYSVNYCDRNSDACSNYSNSSASATSDRIAELMEFDRMPSPSGNSICRQSKLDEDITELTKPINLVFESILSLLPEISDEQIEEFRLILENVKQITSTTDILD